ncbi:MAG: response regulator [Chloroflexi bacterium]|nr:response regulator [Chloroflexota bacterium]
MIANNVDASINDKKRILIIDDDANFLLGISRTLMKADYDVISASDGMYGIKMAQTDHPDLILLDVNMPKMTGFQVKMVLNRLPITQSIPVIFLTALSDRTNILSGLYLAEDYITKPFDADILIARLKALLRTINLGYRKAVKDSKVTSFSMETLQQWGESIEIYDSGTAGHTLRVTRWAVALARSLGLASAELEIIRKSSMLHDIGKLAIPDSILNKPGPLTSDEWKIIHEHPVLGYQMLSATESLRPLRDIPLCHHERWDGLGYPGKLRGEEIPLVARIFSIVDVYDALLSNRPYKFAIEESVVKEMIFSQREKQFDPKIVDHFLSNFDTLKKEVANELN